MPTETSSPATGLPTPRSGVLEDTKKRAQVRVRLTFDPNQPRDEDGKWTDAGGSAGASAPATSERAKRDPKWAALEAKPAVQKAAATLGLRQNRSRIIGLIIDSYNRSAELIDDGTWQTTLDVEKDITDEVASDLTDGDPDTYEDVRQWVDGNPEVLRKAMGEFRGKLPNGALAEMERAGTKRGQSIAEEVNDARLASMIDVPDHLWMKTLSESEGVTYLSELTKMQPQEGFSSFGITGEELDEFNSARETSMIGILSVRMAELRTRMDTKQVEIPSSVPEMSDADARATMERSWSAVVGDLPNEHWAAVEMLGDKAGAWPARDSAVKLAMAQGYTKANLEQKRWERVEGSSKVAHDFTNGWHECEAIRTSDAVRRAELNAAIKKAEEVVPEAGVTVWRGANNVPSEAMEALMRAKEIEWTAPSSTTLDFSVASTFASNGFNDPRVKDKSRLLTNNQVIFEIHNAKGLVPYIESANPSEVEMIVRGGTRMKITGYKRQPWNKFSRSGNSVGMQRLIVVGEFIQAGESPVEVSRPTMKTLAARLELDGLRGLRFVDSEFVVDGEMLRLGPQLDSGGPVTLSAHVPKGQLADFSAVAAVRAARAVAAIGPAVRRGDAGKAEETLTDALARLIYATRMRATAAGMASARGATKLDARSPRDELLNPDGNGQVDFEAEPWWDVIDEFYAREILTRAQFDLLPITERTRAFTFARAASRKVIEIAQDSLTEALTYGLDLGHFEEAFEYNLEANGLALTEAMTPWYLENVFRTNILSAYGEGRKAIFLGVTESRPYWVWRAVQDDRTRPEHAEMHGLAMRWDDPTWERLGPPAGYQCFLPGTAMQGTIIGASRAWYEGKAIELITKGGRRLSVTANHPVLTSSGLVPACGIRQGDELICYGTKSERTLSTCDENDAPTKAEEVFGSLAHASQPAITRPCGDDFHGEAASFVGEVDVVGSYGELARRREAARGQGASDLGLVLPHTLRPGVGHAMDSGSAEGLPEPCGGHLRPSLSADSMTEPRLSESAPLVLRPGGTTDRGVGGGDLCGPLVAGHPAPLQPLRVGPAAKLDATLLERSAKHIAADVSLVTDLLQRFASDVSLDQVIEVREFDYSGHVFDFESSHGWVIGNGIFASNCRCTLTAISEEEALDEHTEVIDGGDERVLAVLATGFDGEAKEALGLSAALLWDPNQPRDDEGRWTDEGGGLGRSRAEPASRVSSQSKDRALQGLKAAVGLGPLPMKMLPDLIDEYGWENTEAAIDSLRTSRDANDGAIHREYVKLIRSYSGRVPTDLIVAAREKVAERAALRSRPVSELQDGSMGGPDYADPELFHIPAVSTAMREAYKELGREELARRHGNFERELEKVGLEQMISSVRALPFLGKAAVEGPAMEATRYSQHYAGPLPDGARRAAERIGTDAADEDLSQAFEVAPEQMVATSGDDPVSDISTGGIPAVHRVATAAYKARLEEVAKERVEASKVDRLEKLKPRELQDLFKEHSDKILERVVENATGETETPAYALAAALIAADYPAVLTVADGYDPDTLTVTPEDVMRAASTEPLAGPEEDFRRALSEFVYEHKSDMYAPSAWVSEAHAKGETAGQGADDEEDYMGALEDFNPHWFGATSEEEEAFVKGFREGFQNRESSFLYDESFSELPEVESVSEVGLLTDPSAEPEIVSGVTWPPPFIATKKPQAYAEAMTTSQLTHAEKYLDSTAIAGAKAVGHDFTASWERCKEIRNENNHRLEAMIEVAESGQSVPMLYRGLNNRTEEEVRGLMEAETFELKKMSSFTASADIAEAFAKDEYQGAEEQGVKHTGISVIVAARDARGFSVAGISRNTVEAEFIMRKGTKVRITDRFRMVLRGRATLVLVGDYEQAPPTGSVPNLPTGAVEPEPTKLAVEPSRPLRRFIQEPGSISVRRGVVRLS